MKSSAKGDIEVGADLQWTPKSWNIDAGGVGVDRMRV